jgi:hypothetical protein
MLVTENTDDIAAFSRTRTVNVAEGFMPLHDRDHTSAAICALPPAKRTLS